MDSLPLIKNQSLNLHENFKDLNPEYNKIKLARAKDLAAEWAKKLESKLHKETNIVAKENFNVWLKDGNRLSYNHLRKLNTVWKKDYVAEVVGDSKVM